MVFTRVTARRLVAAGQSGCVVVDLQSSVLSVFGLTFQAGVFRLGGVALGSPGAQGPGLEAAGGAAPWTVAVQGEGVGPGDEFVLVGVGELEGQEDGLGGDATDASGAGFSRRSRRVSLA